jgi:rod shape-determining protein MreB
MAAALGAGIDVNDAHGNMVVDIGGGTSEVAVIALGDIVTAQSVRVAGDDIDEAIINFIRKKHNMLIGERTAEEIKIKVGKVFDVPTRKQPEMNVRGRCLIKGLPKVVSFNANETLDALIEPLTAIIDTICLVIERTPPELLGDIYKNGIVLTGGGSKLTGLDKLIEKTTGIRTYLANDPISCVALGTGKSLEELEGGLKGFLGGFGNS